MKYYLERFGHSDLAVPAAHSENLVFGKGRGTYTVPMESMGMFIFGVTGTTSSNGICVSIFIFGCIRAFDMGNSEYKHTHRFQCY